jgi:hypothetical protein
MSEKTDSSKRTFSEISQYFDEEEMLDISKSFPNYLEDLFFGGSKKLLRLSASNYPFDVDLVLGSAKLSVTFEFISENGLRSISYNLKKKQVEYFQKMLERGILVNHSTHDLLEIIEKYEHELGNDGSLKYHYEVEMEENFNRKDKLSKSLLIDIYAFQSDVMDQKDYDDITYIINGLFINDCVISIGEYSILADLVDETDEYVSIHISPIYEDDIPSIENLVCESIETKILKYTKVKFDELFKHNVQTVYHFEENFIRKHIPYIVEIYKDTNEFCLLNRDLEYIGLNTSTLNLIISGKRHYLFRVESSPIYGGNFQRLKAVSRVYFELTQDKICMHPDIENTLRLFELASN